MKQQFWKDKLKQWKPLVEDKDDPSYSQDTYNAYMLLALSSERGGNRDEVKNDIRAVPEVLTVNPLEAVEGGVQKQLGDHFLSTVKLRIRLPRGIDRDILTQQIAQDINKMRGVAVRRHTSEIGQELREEDVPYQQRPSRKSSLRKGYNRLTKTGPNDSGPFKRMPLDPDWKSAAPGAAGGLEEGEGCGCTDHDWPKTKIKIKIRPQRPGDLEEGEKIDALKKWGQEKLSGAKLGGGIPITQPTSKGEPRATTPPPRRPGLPPPTDGPDAPLPPRSDVELEPGASGWTGPDRPARVRGSGEDWQTDYGSPMPGGKPTREFHLEPKPHPILPAKKPHHGEDIGRYFAKGPWKKALKSRDLTPTNTLSSQELYDLGAPPKIQVPGKPPGVKERPMGPPLPPEMIEPADIEKTAWKSRLNANAPANMEIIAVRDGGTYGNQVVGRFCDQGTGKCYHTSFNHLKKLPDFEVGQRLKKGDVIGRMGSTGQSSAPHLHHELWEEPESYLATGNVPKTRSGKNIAWDSFIDDAQKRKTKSVRDAWLASQGVNPEKIATGAPWKRNPYLRERRQVTADGSKKVATMGSALNKIKIKIRPYGGELITSFEVQPNLNSDIWEGNQMRSEIRERLREIAAEFIEKLALTKVDIKDIILTGSLANYNWSAYSDLDVHIVIDFRDIAEDEGLVKKYFDAVRSNWNRKHDIKVKGFEVELYVQDDDESHTSTGVYSLLNDEWILEPSHKLQEIDKVKIFKKARHIMRDIDKVQSRLDRQEYASALELGHRVKDKIKRMRSGGLDKGGIYSAENLAFKVLRRGGYMGKLIDSLNLAYDAQQSLTEQE
jgi:predicted nucleotidyltransferase